MKQNSNRKGKKYKYNFFLWFEASKGAKFSVCMYVFSILIVFLER